MENMLTMHFFNLFCVDNKVGKRLNTGNNVFATQLMLCYNSGMSVRRLQVFYLFYNTPSIQRKKRGPAICLGGQTHLLYSTMSGSQMCLDGMRSFLMPSYFSGSHLSL